MTTAKIIKKQSVKRILDEMKRFNISFEDLLAESFSVADVWSTEELDNMMGCQNIYCEPKLTKEEKLAVLQAAVDPKNYEVEKGVNWTVLEDLVRSMYGDRIIKD